MNFDLMFTIALFIWITVLSLMAWVAAE